jgi:O-antigen/teichoic acid export membrane protein
MSNQTSLKKRVLNAGGWTLGGIVAGHVIRLAGNLILTRLLAPEMFGVMAIIYVLMSGFTLVTDVGLNQNIIQSRRGDEPEFLNTVWIVQICRGALIWLIALSISGLLYALGQVNWLPADSVYADPILPVVIAVYSMTQFIVGFQSTKVALARRKLAIAKLAKLQLLSQTLTLVFITIWAFISPSIWALVGGTILGAISDLLIYHLLLPGPRNRFYWDKNSFTEIINFGKWIFISSAVGFLVFNSDRLLLGGFVDAHQLGLYSIAFIFVSLPQVVLAQMAVRVAFPAFSEITRESPEKLKETYYKFRVPFDLAQLFMAGFLFRFSESLIKFLYDSRYVEAGPIMAILSVGIIATRYQLVEQCFIALGKTKLLLLLNIARLISVFSVIPALYFFHQFTGAIWGIVIAQFLTIPIILFLKSRHKLLDWKREVTLLPTVLIGVVAGEVMSRALNSVMS